VVRASRGGPGVAFSGLPMGGSLRLAAGSFAATGR
jgi:hypothetical protein